MTEAFIHGFILALGLIIPPGVQNVFLFNQGALHSRWSRALPAVITASICDTILIVAAVYGVSLLILGSFWLKTILICGGIIFLFYMGWNLWSSPISMKEGEEEVNKFSAKKQILFAASVSLLNPHAILDTIGVIGPSSLKYEGEEKLLFAGACILVSWLWFVGLAILGRGSRNLDRSGKLLLFLNKMSAVVMWAAAIYLGFSFITER